MVKTKNIVLDLIYLLIGNSIMAFGVTYFILPNQILSGGVAGIAVALEPIFHIDPQIMMNFIIFGTFILGLVFLGRSFAVKTVASSLLYPLLIWVFTRILTPEPIEPIMASIYGGLIMGIGLGLTFRTGSSTGGMDIPPLILEKYTRVRVAIWILILDGLTVMLGLKSYGLNNVLIGALSVFASTMAVDKIQMIGGEEAKQVLIISDKNEEILKVLHHDIDRGSTLIMANGGYTKEKREIIMTVLMKTQYPELEKVVKEVDENAFLIVSNVTEVHGNGFYKL